MRTPKPIPESEIGQTTPQPTEGQVLRSLEGERGPNTPLQICRRRQSFPRKSSPLRHAFALTHTRTHWKSRSARRMLRQAQSLAVS